jgi:hypothetical protein
MDTFRFELKFTKSDHHGPPIAYVCLKNYGPDADGDPAITVLDCHTISELERQIDKLLSELEVIRAQARTRFGADGKAWRAAAGDPLKALRTE